MDEPKKIQPTLVLSRARSPVDGVNLAGKTPLHVACAWGQEQVVEDRTSELKTES